MKVVIDTNVLVSAVLKDKEPETVLLFIVTRPDIEWIVSPQILEEYKEVLSRKKFGLPDNIKSAWFSLLDKLTTILDEMLPKSYTPEVYHEKCTVAYQHVYDSYYGDGKSVYASA